MPWPVHNDAATDEKFILTRLNGDRPMPTVQVVSEVKLDLHTVLDGVAQLELSELERFASDVNSLVARRKAPSLSRREARLLQQVNQGISADDWQRYTALNSQLLDETLSQEEHDELLRLVDAIEQADAERLAALIELAQLRDTTLDALMDQLGIRRAVHA